MASTLTIQRVSYPDIDRVFVQYHIYGALRYPRKREFSAPLLSFELCRDYRVILRLLFCKSGNFDSLFVVRLLDLSEREV